MKNISLTVKIWLSISLVSLLLYVFFLLIMPFLIRNFFTATLTQAPAPPPRKYFWNEPLTPLFSLHGFDIHSFIVLQDGETIPSQVEQSLPSPVLQQVIHSADAQKQSTRSYEDTIGQDKFRYVIYKDMAYGKPFYQVVFLRRSEEDNSIKALIFNIMLFAGIALLISWFASLFIARYLTGPLVKMEQHVKRIAGRHWHEPLVVKQGGEIGQLAGTIENMRRQLVRQDETQASMLQNISHELKTPVMVIRSYARAILEGVYPKGDLAGSIQVIDEEGVRLEKLVKQLLYLTRLDYLANKNTGYGKIELDKLINTITQRLYLQRPDIERKLDLEPVSIEGEEETLQVMVENLMENHLRHAASRVEISLKVNREKPEVILCFFNDGSRIEPHILSQLFEPFHKGRMGKFGLGLTIVQRIVKMHQGEIQLVNGQNGVFSIVRLPVANT